MVYTQHVTYYPHFILNSDYVASMTQLTPWFSIYWSWATHYLPINHYLLCTPMTLLAIPHSYPTQLTNAHLGMPNRTLIHINHDPTCIWLASHIWWCIHSTLVANINCEQHTVHLVATNHGVTQDSESYFIMYMRPTLDYTSWRQDTTCSQITIHGLPTKNTTY